MSSVSPKEYRTSETLLATYLLAEGFNLLIIEYDDKGNGNPRATYVFEESSKLEECIKIYDRGEAVVNLTIYDHIRSGLLVRIKRGIP
jgi:hypothetical protein